MHAAWRGASCTPFFALGFGPSPETGASPHAMPRVILRGCGKIVLEWLISNGRRYAALGSSEMIRRPLRSNWLSSRLCGTAVLGNVLSACMKVFHTEGSDTSKDTLLRLAFGSSSFGWRCLGLVRRCYPPVCCRRRAGSRQTVSSLGLLCGRLCLFPPTPKSQPLGGCQCLSGLLRSLMWKT
jgi:hypothetical protein